MIVKTSMAAPDIIIGNGTDIKVWCLNNQNLFFGFYLYRAHLKNNFQWFDVKVYLTDTQMHIIQIIHYPLYLTLLSHLSFSLSLSLPLPVILCLSLSISSSFSLSLSLSYQSHPLGANGWAITAGHGPHVPDVHQLQVLHPQAPRLHKV